MEANYSTFLWLKRKFEQIMFNGFLKKSKTNLCKIRKVLLTKLLLYNYSRLNKCSLPLAY